MDERSSGFGGTFGNGALAGPRGTVVVHANELEYFGDTSTGGIRR